AVIPPDLPPFDAPSDADAPPETFDNVIPFDRDESSAGRRTLHYDTRPGIRMTCELHQVVDEAVDAIAGDPGVYQRDGSLVVVLRTGDDQEDPNPLAKRSRTKGTPILRALTVASVRERLTAVANWYKHDARTKTGWKKAVPTDHVVQALLARGAWRSLRHLV